MQSLGLINVTHSADSVALDNIPSSYADLEDYFPSENYTWWKAIASFQRHLLLTFLFV